MSDPAVLAAIHAACMPGAWSSEEFAGLLGQPGVFLFKTDADGFILCREAGDECEILTFAVRPECQGMGMGYTLLQRAMEEARARGACAMFLEVGEDNAAALALYRRVGFGQVGLRRNYYASQSGEPKDALVMRLDLA